MPKEFTRAKILYILKRDKEYLLTESKKRGEEDEPSLVAALLKIDLLLHEAHSLSTTEERLVEIYEFLMRWGG